MDYSVNNVIIFLISIAIGYFLIKLFFAIKIANSLTDDQKFSLLRAHYPAMEIPIHIAKCANKVKNEILQFSKDIELPEFKLIADSLTPIQKIHLEVLLKNERQSFDNISKLLQKHYSIFWWTRLYKKHNNNSSEVIKTLLGPEIECFNLFHDYIEKFTNYANFVKEKDLINISKTKEVIIKLHDDNSELEYQIID